MVYIYNDGYGLKKNFVADNNREGTIGEELEGGKEEKRKRDSDLSPSKDLEQTANPSFQA